MQNNGTCSFLSCFITVTVTAVPKYLGYTSLLLTMCCTCVVLPPCILPLSLLHWHVCPGAFSLDLLGSLKALWGLLGWPNPVLNRPFLMLRKLCRRWPSKADSSSHGAVETCNWKPCRVTLKGKSLWACKQQPSNMCSVTSLLLTFSRLQQFCFKVVTE